jgi:hypothetical protein
MSIADGERPRTVRDRKSISDRSKAAPLTSEPNHVPASRCERGDSLACVRAQAVRVRAISDQTEADGVGAVAADHHHERARDVDPSRVGRTKEGVSNAGVVTELECVRGGDDRRALPGRVLRPVEGDRPAERGAGDDLDLYRGRRIATVLGKATGNDASHRNRRMGLQVGGDYA